MTKIKSLDELGIDWNDVPIGQRIGITGKKIIKSIINNKVKKRDAYSGMEYQPILIIGTFNGKAGHYLNLVNYIQTSVEIGISESDEFEIGKILGLIYEKFPKQTQYNFPITDFGNLKGFMLPR